ncbi:MAG TPA: hypothetical protein VGC90_01160 [Candidatus Limnocylindrales bacterium]
MTYRERATSLPGAVLWDGSRLFVAGPDTTARLHSGRADACPLGLRFSGGTGPALLGIPADELRDRSPDLADLWRIRRPGAPVP